RGGCGIDSSRAADRRWPHRSFEPALDGASVAVDEAVATVPTCGASAGTAFVTGRSRPPVGSAPIVDGCALLARIRPVISIRLMLATTTRPSTDRGSR